ncbi:hypothetical protein FACS189494_06410 [Spirochaetia bacterium]|nr:hypothetical protein FACS189494_06410 [Spirochaetia bacterium]
MIKGIAKFILALNGNVKKSQIAAGAAWGVLLGILPSGNVFWMVLLLLSLFLRHNQGGKLLTLAVMKLFMPLLYPLTDQLGWTILHIENLTPIFTTLYNMPFVPFSHFNNTLVAGGLVAGIVLWLPVFFIFIILVSIYRNTLLPKVVNSKIVKKLQNIPIVQKIFSSVNALKSMQSIDIE